MIELYRASSSFLQGRGHRLVPIGFMRRFNPRLAGRVSAVTNAVINSTDSAGSLVFVPDPLVGSRS